MTTKSCLDCRWCRADPVKAVCLRCFETTEASQADATVVVKYSDNSLGAQHIKQATCQTARADQSLCGKEGKHWEARV